MKVAKQQVTGVKTVTVIVNPYVEHIALDQPVYIRSIETMDGKDFTVTIIVEPVSSASASEPEDRS